MNQVYAGLSLARLLDHSADAVAAVRCGRSLSDVLVETAAEVRPGVQALSFQVLRRLGAAMAMRERLAPRKPPAAVEALLLCGIALLWPDSHAPYPDHTLVDQAVAAARRRTPAAAGFVNAVLRRFIRERTLLLESLNTQPQAVWNHPLWWIERLRQDWPQQWQAILEASHQHPPMTLRVQARRTSVPQYLEALAQSGRLAWPLEPATASAQAVQLAQPCAVTELPGFEAGEVSVQDAAAQRAAPLLIGTGLPPQARVLDACAAPGGKTAHLLELADLDVLALDHDSHRLQRVQQNLARLGLQARLAAGDASHPQDWWDGRPFDAILLDAPCSASGIVRRHPDVCWLRRPSDIDRLAAQQLAMLDALWPLLKPGGRLLYATCSVFRAEGQEVIDAFLQRQAPGTAAVDPASPGHLLPLPQNGARSPLSGERAMPADGFFYALLHKTLSP